MKKSLGKVFVGTMLLGCMIGVSLSQPDLVEAKSTANSKYIGTTKAKSIALKHAGLTSSQIKYVRAEMDTEDGKKVYEIEFYNGNKEYDYEIDAKTGKILSYDYDIENYQVSGKIITESKAKSIALTHAGLKESEVTFVKSKLDYDDGQSVYEIEFYNGKTEYDYEVSATSGKILSFDKDIEDFKAPATSTGSYISKSKALNIALNHAKLTSSQVTSSKVKLDSDDGRMEYEIEFKTSSGEYEYTIDAVSGKILDFERDLDD